MRPLGRFGMACALIAGLITIVPLTAADATVSGTNGRIIYSSVEDGDADIYSIDPDGSDKLQLTHNSVPDTQPAWSPDGQSIAFVRESHGVPAVWVMNADGSDGRHLVEGTNPAWSPDGTMIAFAGSRQVLAPTQADSSEPWVQDLSVVVAATGDSWQVTDAASDDAWAPWVRWVSYREPVWSPDGTGLAFIRHRGGPTPTANAFGWSLLIASVSDQAKTLVVERAVPGPSAHPDWAPDGQSIAAITAHSLFGTAFIVVVDLASGSQRNLLPEFADNEWPSSVGWSPDGNRMVVTTPAGLFDMSVDDLARNPITTNASAGAWQPLNPYAMGLVDPTTGMWHLRDATGRVESFYYGNPGDLPFMGDWDCDGTDTPGLYRQTDGYVYLRNSNDSGVAETSFFFGNPGDMPIAGDFNGNGCDTVSVYRPADSQVFIVNQLGDADRGLGPAEVDYVFGDPGDTPFVGDFDGDGTDTIGLYRQSTGLIYYRNSHSQGNADGGFFFGDPGDRFVASDWSNAGIDAPGVYRPSNTTHYFRFTNTSGSANAQYIWGHRTWLPVAGTYTHE